MVDELAAKLHFFHWELEFPDVFARPEHGFDAVLANPPWDIAKSESLEFFADYDPLYRTYGRQEALIEQQRLFDQDQNIEREWLLYLAYFKDMSNWSKKTVSPFGDPNVKNMDFFNLKPGKQGEQLHQIWRNRRSNQHSYVSEQDHPFHYQGTSFLNTYKMFLEVAHHLIKQKGRLGMLVPSNIYTDQGSAALRKLFLDHCNWEWLFGFINWQHIFDIYYRFKFAFLILEKGGCTQHLRAAFNRTDLKDLDQLEICTLLLPRELIERFSPNSSSIVEPQRKQDLDILEKLYTGTILFGAQFSDSWQLQYTTEFNMTTHSNLFPPLPKWEARGYSPDGYGHWIDPANNIALPLYEGRMIGAFDPCEKGWVSGKGRGAIWRSLKSHEKVLEPQYLMSLDTYRAQEKVMRGHKVGFMDIGSAANTRSMYATFVNDMPCGNVVPVIQPKMHDIANVLTLTACLNSFVYDYALRCRLGGLHLNYFVVAETPLVLPARIRPTICAQLAARLNLIMPCFAPHWLEMRHSYSHLGQQHWRKLWAITEHERLRLRCILDAIIAELYGLAYDDFAWILRDDSTNLKGFQRVDKDKPKELRHTTLALAAFKRLKEVGLEAFSQEDWQFPTETAAQLGLRFTAWQEQGTIAESWAECEEHAHRMKEILPPEKEQPVSKSESSPNGQKNGRSNGASPAQQSLWEPEHEQLSLWGED